MQPIAHGTRRTDDLCCWPECFHPVEHPDIPLCEQHLREVGLAWVRDNLDLVREVVEATPEHVVLARAAAGAAARIQARPPAESIVYYVRIGDLIKIGTTTNLRQRLASLRIGPRDLLATEPGGIDVERQRHQQFADERYGRREDFASSERLLAHIASLQ